MRSEIGVPRQIRKNTKKPPFRCGQKICGNLYSLPNTVTPDLGKEENRVNHRIYGIKLKQVNLRLTDVE